MSGGSFDYLYSKEPGEQFDRLVRGDADELVNMLRSLLDGPIDRWNAESKEWTKYSATEAERAAINAAVGEILAITQLFRVLSERVGGCADLFHDLEWWRSGDYGPDNGIRAAVKWHEAHRALPSTPLEREAVAATARTACGLIQSAANNALATVAAIMGQSRPDERLP